MAYSMNWRPQLDEISESSKPESSTSRPLGPIPGILPPSRTAPPAGRPNGSMQFSNVYSMNWRPKYDDEEEEEAQHFKPAPVPASRLTASAHSRALDHQAETKNDARIFRVSLSEECPEVECIGSTAFACVKDGMACTLEKGAGVPSIGVPPKWTMHLHPSSAKLSHQDTMQLAQVTYCCLYAALSKSHEAALRLKLSTDSLGQSAQKALHRLGMPQDLSLPITPSFLLQLYTHAEPHLLTHPFPFFQSQSFKGSHKPVAHPARPPTFAGQPELVYSRFNPSSNSHVRLYSQDGAEGSQWVTVIAVEPAAAPSPQASADKATRLQVSWALEDPAFEKVASQIQDYDRGKPSR